MANKFTIVINATDQATKVVRGVKNSISSIVRPISNLHKSVASFRKEIGIDKLGKGFSTLGKKGAEMASKLGVMTGPMAALGGATTVAGIAALASEWGRLGIEVDNAAANIGMANSKLMTMQGMERLAGAASGSMTSGLKTLGDTMEDALFGRNQQALVMLNRLGVGIHHTADGAIDAERGFSDLADAIARQKNPQVQGIIARQFGLEGLLPLLRKGKAGVEEFKRTVQQLNPVTEEQAQAAAAFGRSQNKLGVAITGVGNTIEQRMIPKIQPLIDGLTNWIGRNRDTSATIAELGSSLGVIGGIAAAVAFVFGAIPAAIAAAVAGLVAGVALIYTHWDGIADYFSKKIEQIKSVFIGFGRWIKSVIPGGLAQNLGLNMNTPNSANTSAAPASIPLSVQSQMSISNAAAGQPAQKMHVELDVKGLPKGSSARAKTGMGTYLPTRVNYSMPTMVSG